MELDVLEGGSCLINNIRLSIYDFYLRNIKKPTCCKCGQVAILKINKKDAQQSDLSNVEINPYKTNLYSYSKPKVGLLQWLLKMAI